MAQDDTKKREEKRDYKFDLIKGFVDKAYENQAAKKENLLDGIDKKAFSDAVEILGRLVYKNAKITTDIDAGLIKLEGDEPTENEKRTFLGSPEMGIVIAYANNEISRPTALSELSQCLGSKDDSRHRQAEKFINANLEAAEGVISLFKSQPNFNTASLHTLYLTESKGKSYAKRYQIYLKTFKVKDSPRTKNEFHKLDKLD